MHEQYIAQYPTTSVCICSNSSAFSREVLKSCPDTVTLNALSDNALSESSYYSVPSLLDCSAGDHSTSCFSFGFVFVVVFWNILHWHLCLGTV